MSYQPLNQLFTLTSADGINSDSVTSGGNWSVNTYTGQWEQNDYPYVGVNLQVDEAGTLYFDFSQDGVNFSSYPVNGFTIASGINEVHTAWKGGRYFRVRFVGTGGRSYFRLKTYYAQGNLPLSAPLNQSISSDQDATVVRAVLTGQIPDGSFINEPADGAGFRTTANLSDGSIYDSGVLNLDSYTQVGTSVVCDNNGTLRFIFGSSATMSGATAGVNGVERVITVPYSASTGYQYYSAPAFTPYVRYEFENTAGQGSTTQLFFDTRFVTKSISGQILRMDGFISPSMVANLGRSVIVGTKPDGNFGNVSITETSNVDGIYENLNVVSGARPSQLSGRTAKHLTVDITANTLLNTTTVGKTVYITDMILTVDNSNTTATGRLNIRNGITATGSISLPILAQEAPTSETAITVITHAFVEPLPFDTGIFLELAAGTLTVTGHIMGYEE